MSDVSIALITGGFTIGAVVVTFGGSAIADRLKARRAAKDARDQAIAEVLAASMDGGRIVLDAATRAFGSAVRRARKALGEDELPRISVHGLRHTHATIALRNAMPVHVLARRLGHSSPMITLGAYAHVLKGEQAAFSQAVADAAAQAAAGQVPETSITHAPPAAAGGA